jgi:ferritin-like metal-binding protein YciE
VRYVTLETVLDEQIRELLVGELQTARQLPRLMVDVSSSELKDQLKKTLEECHARIDRLERVLKTRHVGLEAGQSRVVDALIKQASDVTQHRGDDLLLDHGLVSVLRHLESYQRSAYESAREVASAISAADIVEALDVDVEQHGRMERYFTILEEDMLDAVAASQITSKRATRPWETAAR